MSFTDIHDDDILRIDHGIIYATSGTTGEVIEIDLGRTQLRVLAAQAELDADDMR